MRLRAVKYPWPYPNSQDAKSAEPEHPEGQPKRARCESQPMVALGRSDVYALFSSSGRREAR